MKGFKQFITRGNVVDLAVGVVIGSAFGAVVNSLVKDLITPLIGAIIRVPSFSNLTITVRGSQFHYGDFLNTLLTFVIIAAAVYFFVVVPLNALMSRLHHEAPADPTNKKCPECLSEIPIGARRCSHCTTVLSN